MKMEDIQKAAELSSRLSRLDRCIRYGTYTISNGGEYVAELKDRDAEFVRTVLRRMRGELANQLADLGVETPPEPACG